jgi:anti-sigma regulatory factor (Ser/Thr protein kinase)
MAATISLLPTTAERRLEVTHRAHLVPALRLARETAESVGFDSLAAEEVALVVSELATNVLKHSGGGELRLKPLRRGRATGLQIETLDRGAGIADVGNSLRDGFSTVGTLGVGLGAVNRLSDQLKIKARTAGGTHITCCKWVREAPAIIADHPLEFGAASRAKSGENGDEFILRQGSGCAVAGVIDGCGHGEFARRAAGIARHYVEHHFDRPLPEIFLGVERDCRATRGVVMALARFDWAAGEVQFASVGDIQTRLLQGGTSLPVRVRRGILGAAAPSPVLTTHPWRARKPARHALRRPFAQVGF